MFALGGILSYPIVKHRQTDKVFNSQVNLWPWSTF